MSMPLLKAKLKAQMRKEATSLPVAMEAQTKTRTRQLALRAVNGDLNELDFDNLDALNRIKGQLSNTHLESISAAKITSATMLATTLTLAGTDASANKTSLVMIGDALLRVNDGTADRIRISNSGVELSATGESNTPAQIVGRGIFNTGSHHSGLWIFENSPSRRGFSMRSDGVSGGINGHLRLIATAAAAATATSTQAWASVETDVSGSGSGVISGRAGIILRNMLWCVGPARIGGDMDVVGRILAGNVSCDAVLASNLRPQIIWGTPPAGDWYWIAGGSNKYFNYSGANPQTVRVLYSSTANYDSARPTEQTGTLTWSLDAPNNRILVSNSTGTGFYFNVAAWRH